MRERESEREKEREQKERERNTREREEREREKYKRERKRDRNDIRDAPEEIDGDTRREIQTIRDRALYFAPLVPPHSTTLLLLVV